MTTPSVPETLPAGEAVRRLTADRDLLLAQVEGLTDEQLTASYQVGAGPLGDFCESLHDLVAHVLMWDEINLAVLTEAAAGRSHWSLDPRWETTEAGRMLNRGGVAAGRYVPGHLLLHWFGAVHSAVLAELGRYTGEAWTRAGLLPGASHGVGALAQRVWTVPGQPAFTHAAIHLRQLSAVVPAAR